MPEGMGGPRTAGEGQGVEKQREHTPESGSPGAGPDSGCRPLASAVRGVGRGRRREKEQEHTRGRVVGKG